MAKSGVWGQGIQTRSCFSSCLFHHTALVVHVASVLKVPWPTWAKLSGPEDACLGLGWIFCLLLRRRSRKDLLPLTSLSRVFCRLAQEAALQKFQEELESFQRSEEARLKEQMQFSLERMKKEVEAAQQVEQMALEQESQRALRSLKERLRRENKMVRCPPFLSSHVAPQLDPAGAVCG